MTTVHMNSDDLYEEIDGRPVKLPDPSVQSLAIASVLTFLVHRAVRDGIGFAVAHLLVELALPKSRKRRPDVIFVPYSVWPKGKATPHTNAWAITPTICVEVVSPNDEAEELMTKVTEYLDAGVSQVWVIYPVTRAAVVYDATGPARLLRAADTLDGDPHLPGFAVKLADLMPEPEAA